MTIDGSAVIEKLYQERVQDIVSPRTWAATKTPVDACLRICSDRLYELGGWNHSNINRPWIDEAYAKVLAAPHNREERREVWLEMADAVAREAASMVYGQFSRGSLLNVYHRRVKGAYWMQSYAIPVRSAIRSRVAGPVLGRAVASSPTDARCAEQTAPVGSRRAGGLTAAGSSAFSPAYSWDTSTERRRISVAARSGPEARP